MHISADIRTFGLRSTMLALASVCVSLAVAPNLPAHGFALPAAVAVFWCGIGLFAASDTVDNGPINSRNTLSQVLNIAGILAVIFAMLTCVICLGLNFIVCWLFRGL